MLPRGRDLWSITLPPFALVQNFGRSHADENEPSSLWVLVLRLKVDALFGDAGVSFSPSLTNPCQREDFLVHSNCPFLRTMKSVQLIVCVLPSTPKLWWNYSFSVRFVQACVSSPRSEVVQCWKMQIWSLTFVAWRPKRLTYRLETQGVNNASPYYTLKTRWVHNASPCCTLNYIFFLLLFSHLTYSRWTSSLPSCLWSQRIFPSLPGSRLTIFYRDASSALLQLVDQWLNFTYSRSHAFRYERKNTNPTLVRMEPTTFALASNRVSWKSRLKTIRRLNPLFIFPVTVRNSLKGKYFRHLTHVLVRFPETKGMSKFTVPHFSRGESAVHSSVEHIM